MPDDLSAPKRAGTPGAGETLLLLVRPGQLVRDELGRCVATASGQTWHYITDADPAAGSGLTFLRWLARRTGRRVPPTGLDWRGLCAAVSDDLRALDSPPTLVLENLHAGLTPLGAEPLTVADAAAALALQAPIAVVATSWPLPPWHQVAHDRAVAVPTVGAVFDEVVAARAIATLSASTRLAPKVLRVLGGTAEPLDLFAVCDALEDRGSDQVFEPEVERTLWTLAPVVETSPPWWGC